MRGMEQEEVTGMREVAVELGGWEKPGVGVKKVNVNAGILAGFGVGWGVVCRDEVGRVEWGIVVQDTVVRDPKFAEAEAILLGLTEARNVGIRKVIVESDCLEVLKDLEKRKAGRSDIFLVYEEIHLISCWFEFVSFSFPRRKYNTVAHELAHFVPWSLGRRVWTDEVPHYIANVVNDDLKL
ncbi:uncharacterized protein LOC141608197 [Silene latifolia]|uniref:uncharacterized protein LOC141608197 n=1 Tax=Silene latifolia TaxID=37657 RepID=UPI003D7897A2